jgi:hypothetical protein
LYLGDGFSEGQKGEGEEDAASGLRVSLWLMVVLGGCAAVLGMV